MGFNEPTEFGAENIALARRYGVGNPPVGTVASDVFPMVALGDSTIDPELYALKGGRLCVISLSDSAVAAQYSHVGLTNPAGSGVIAVVDEIWMTSSIATDIAVGLEVPAVNAADLTGAGTVRDSRQFVGASQTTVQYFQRTQATSINSNGFAIPVLVQTPIILTKPWVLLPNSRILVRPAVVNAAVEAAFFWRERRAVSSELAL